MKNVIYPIVMFIAFTAAIVSYFIFQTEQVRLNGWVHEKGGRYYYENGKMKIDCWVKSPTGDRYYFDTDGKMTTGWVKLVKIDTIWVKRKNENWLDKSWNSMVLFGEDGKMTTGTLKHSDKYYSLDKQGRLL